MSGHQFRATVSYELTAWVNRSLGVVDKPEPESVLHIHVAADAAAGDWWHVIYPLSSAEWELGGCHPHPAENQAAGDSQFCSSRLTVLVTGYER